MIPDIFLSRFLAMKKVSLQIGIAMLTGMYIMLSLIIVIVNGTEFYNNFSTQHYLLVAIIISITFIWLLAFLGAYMSSITVIKFTFVFWTIYTIAWITIVVIRLAKGDKTSTTVKDELSDDTRKKNEDLRSTPENTPSSPERYIMRTTESLVTHAAGTSVVDHASSTTSDTTGEASEGAADSAVTSEKRRGTTNGDHSDRSIVTKRPAPSEWSTRRRGHAIRIYQENHKALWKKSVTADRGNPPFAAVARRERRASPSDYGRREAVHGGEGLTAEGGGPGSSENYYKYIPTATCFLALYLYSWFVLLSYMVELECIKSCTCQQHQTVPA